MKLFLDYVVWLMFLSVLLYLLPAADRIILMNVVILSVLLSGASSLGRLVPTLVCIGVAPSPLDASVSKYSHFITSQNFMHASYSFIFSFVCQIVFGNWHSMSILPLLMLNI